MNNQISKDEILNQLKTEKPRLAEKYGVIEIGLFGSYAKSQGNIDSDIDLLVELRSPKFEWLAGLQIYLEKKFKQKIELVRKSAVLNHRFMRRVEKDVIYA